MRKNLDIPKSPIAQVRTFARKKEGEKFQQVVFVNFKLEQFISLLDVMMLVYDKRISNKPICIIL